MEEGVDTSSSSWTVLGAFSSQGEDVELLRVYGTKGYIDPGHSKIRDNMEDNSEQTSRIKRPNAERRPVSYAPFLKMAKERGSSEIAGWLAKHNFVEEDARRFGLGYFNPGKDTDMADLLNMIYEDNNVEALRDMDSSFIVVPYKSGGYWVGLPVKDALISIPIVPKVGAPEPWGIDSLYVDDPGPVILSFDLLDALALASIGARSVLLEEGSRQQFVDRMNIKAVEGPLVILPTSSVEDDVDTAEGVAGILGGLGVPVSCYDFSNREKGEEFMGAYHLLTHKGRPALADFVDGVSDWASSDLKTKAAGYFATTTGARLSAFKEAIGERTGLQAIPTGFDRLDAMLDGGLYPGLYVMGAMSSIGKTTFALQVADHIAASGHDVIFYSLEQSAEELVAKSLSRMMAASRPPIESIGYELDDSRLLTPREILYRYSDWIGTKKEEAFEEALFDYGMLAGAHMFVVENDTYPHHVTDSEGNVKEVQSIDRVGLDTIARGIEDHVRLTGSAPVVFVDYLQILRPNDSTGRKSDKQNMDETVSELRRISKEYRVPVFVISSLNRSSYGQSIGMDAFKESGAIEYSSDVLLGLNPVGLDSGEDKKVREANREVMDRLDKAASKSLAVKILKNRLGAKGEVRMVFEARYGLYREESVDTEDPMSDLMDELRGNNG